MLLSVAVLVLGVLVLNTCIYWHANDMLVLIYWDLLTPVDIDIMTYICVPVLCCYYVNMVTYKRVLTCAGMNALWLTFIGARISKVTAGATPYRGVFGAGSGEGACSVSDVTTWVACRTLLDEMGIGDVRTVDSPVPRGKPHSMIAVAVVVVLTLTRISKSVVTEQAPSLWTGRIPEMKNKKTKSGTRMSHC